MILSLYGASYRKTYTLANIALKSFLNGERVLILSHSNIAVDGRLKPYINAQ